MPRKSITRRPFVNPFNNPEMKKETSKETLKLIDAIDRDNQGHLGDLAQWYDAYRGLIGDRTGQPSDEGWSNAHVPITAWNVYKPHESVMGVYESISPLISYKPKNSVAKKFRDQKESYANSLFKDEDQIDGMGIIDLGVLQLMIQGEISGFMSWETWRDFSEEKFIFRPEGSTDFGEAMIRRIRDEAFPENQFEDVIMTRHKSKDDSEGIFRYDVEFTERMEGHKKQPGTAEVEFERLERPEDLGSPALLMTVRMFRTRERPTIDIPPAENVFRSNDFPYRGIDRCKAFGRRLILTLEDIKQRKETGVYDILTDEEMRMIEDKGAGRDATKVPQWVDDLRQDVQGIRRNSSDQEINEWDAVEVFYVKDAMGAGVGQQWIFTILVTSPFTILRARLLTNVFHLRDGRRPVFHIDLIPDQNGHGIGIPELVEGIQTEVNEIHSQGLDWGRMKNAPWFFYRQSSNIKPNARLIRPGSGVPVDDPQSDIAFPRWTNTDTSWAFQQEAQSMSYLERLVIPDVNFGRIPAGKSAAFRTKGGTQNLMAQGGTKLDVFLRRCNRGFSRMASIIDDLERTNRRIPLVYALPDAQDNINIEELPPEARDAPYSITFGSTSTEASKEFRVQRAAEIVAVVSDPVAIQLGIVDQNGLYEARRRFLKELDVDDVDLFLKRPPGVSKEPVLTGIQALQWIDVSGEAPPISPNANTQEQLGTILEFMQSAEGQALPVNRQLVLVQYLGELGRIAQQQAQQQQLAAAAQQFQQGGGLGQGIGEGGTPGPVPNGGPPSLQPGDLSAIPNEFRGA
jgi:hypothetical protein